MGRSAKVTGGPGESPRDRVLRAAMDIILERGIDRLRLSEIAERCRMSTGHILYYFGTKDRILIETLTWSEAVATLDRRKAVADARPGWDQLDAFAYHYLPASADEPRWSIWIEVWARKLHEAHRDDLMKIDRAALRDLDGILARGRDAGVFRSVPRLFSRRFIALLDGLAVRILEGTSEHGRALGLARAQCKAEL